MENFVIMTDSSCDLTAEAAQKYGLVVANLSVLMEGTEYFNYLDERELTFSAYYAKLRNKVPAQTSAVNAAYFEDLMTEQLDKGLDVLYIGFSSALSGTFSVAAGVAESLRAKYPDRKIFTVDSLCASLGQGMLVHYAAEKKGQGASIEETARYAEDLKLKVCHWFTVDDLFFLKRGGRVSTATAVLGTSLGIKPIMKVDNTGHLISVGKVRGRQTSVKNLGDMLKAHIAPDCRLAFISHGDCLDDAMWLADYIKKESHIDEVLINYVGPVIGTHSGPGTLALFFIGSER